MYKNKKEGFSLIELLVVIAIIGILGSIILSAVQPARERARDAKRKAEIAGIGRFLVGSCYTPNAGVGTYDIGELVDELVANNPQYAQYVSQIPKDPSADSEGEETKYMYVINNESKCAVYANLENENEQVTLPNITSPTPGGGKGVLEATVGGWNGTNKYFQVSN